MVSRHHHGGEFGADNLLGNEGRSTRQSVSARQGRGTDGHPDDRSGGPQSPHQAVPDQADRGLAAEQRDQEHGQRTHACCLGDARDTAIDGHEHDAHHDEGRHEALAVFPALGAQFAPEGREAEHSWSSPLKVVHQLG